MRNLHKLPEYKSLDEKKEFFTQVRIDTEKDFEDLFKIILPQKFKQGGIWRGLPESRFKLYNSLQRKNLMNRELDTMADVINFIISSTNELTTWNRGLIPKYFSNYGIKDIHVYAKLSFLQHYGIPTPLLDWTTNPNVALFFATNSKNRSFFNNKIGNYFSIYFIDNEHPYYKLNSKTIYEIPQLDKTFDTDNFWNFVNSGEYLPNEILTSPIYRIDDSVDDRFNHYTKSNYNIIAQNGLFILNADPFKPLEEAIIHRLNSPIIRRNENDPIDEWRRRNIENFICIDIHKKFEKRILTELCSAKVKVTQETMFPDFNKLKDEITFEKITARINNLYTK